jgi:hypothetical protein
MVTPKGSMSTEGETLQVSVLPYRCSICPLLMTWQMSIFGKFQDTECFLIPCPRHVLSWLPPSGETCKYATVPSTQKNLERFSTYWYAPFCCVCLGCCAAKFGISGGTYELSCVYIYIYIFDMGLVRSPRTLSSSSYCSSVYNSVCVFTFQNGSLHICYSGTLFP